MTDTPQAESAFRQAFDANERQVRINTGKIACILVIVLMPFGVSLDHFVYPDKVDDFLKLRLACSGLVAILWALHYTAFAKRFYWAVGLPIVLLPSFFISWMIYDAPDQPGTASPYYAGLNLIMLAVSSVGHWGLLESIAAVGSVIFMYLCASGLRGIPIEPGALFNNVYFLGLTGVIVVTGNVLFNRLRFREFALRLELDGNRRQLEETNRKLIELDQTKSRFFANISHELRTPLTLLLAPLEKLIASEDDVRDDPTRELLLTMRSNGMRLLKLINDLLDLVRLESGRMDVRREPLALAEVLNGLASATRQVANDKHIALETFVDPQLGTVALDRDKLEKVVLNLVFNALKFTAAGGKVTIAGRKQADRLMLTVSDTGVGIAAKNLPFVFDRFWQADTSSKRRYQGAGIGLALVKELVELQGGQVSVASEEGKGTVFTVQFPIVRVDPGSEVDSSISEEPIAARQPPPDGSSQEWLANLYRRAELFPGTTPARESTPAVETSTETHRRRILIADDEPDMRRFLKSQLKSEYRVVEAADGQQAIDKAVQSLPDLILLDMMMPEKDGLQACQELRGNAATASIPVVILTARADEETKLAALKAGASDFLTKPFSSTELHVRIFNLVESYEFHRKLAAQKQLLERTIEQLKDTETQLVESEKMRSLGQLSAGMIHEINNPLNYATTGLYTLRNEVKHIQEERRADYLDIVTDIEEGIKRVKDLVSRMREFSHPDKNAEETVEVAQVVSSALRFLGHQWKSKVEIHQNIPEGQTIVANKNRMVQVVLNLLQNALDAVGEKSFEGDTPSIWIEGRCEPGRSVLSIRDNGTGISPEHLNKIFDPFFTTKEVGRGMGLGLSICYRIVQDFGGRIRVESEPGKSCEFLLEFPARPAERP